MVYVSISSPSAGLDRWGLYQSASHVTGGGGAETRRLGHVEFVGGGETGDVGKNRECRERRDRGERRCRGKSGDGERWDG